MDNLKFYGDEPYKLIMLCGDLDESGILGQYVQDISPRIGVVKVFKKNTSEEAMLSEVAEVIHDYCSGLVTIVGQDKGAEIAYLCARQNPRIINSVVMLESKQMSSKDFDPIEGVKLCSVEKEHFVEKIHALMASE